jgi:hypothetical protein
MSVDFTPAGIDSPSRGEVAPEELPRQVLSAAGSDMLQAVSAPSSSEHSSWRQI